MANNNDLKVLELKKQIEKKTLELGVDKKFNPITNCILILDGTTYNLNTLNSLEQVIPLLVKVNSLYISANDLGLHKDYLVSGYKLEDWKSDIIAKLNMIKHKEEMKKLKVMESKLDKLLSEEKKVELELDDIASILNQ